MVKVRKKEVGAPIYITHSLKCGIQVNAEKPRFKGKMQASEFAMRCYCNTFRNLTEWTGLSGMVRCKFWMTYKTFTLADWKVP